MRLLAIDPGPTQSAYVLIDTDDLVPRWFDKIPNEELLDLRWLATADRVVIEQIGHYGTGMPAGKEVFDTCIWIGRFWQKAQPVEPGDLVPRINVKTDDPVTLVKRATVKTHLCGSAKAKDGNVAQALIDRFAPDTGNRGKGTKNDPGFFYGFAADVWQCYALAVYYADTHVKEAA